MRSRTILYILAIGIITQTGQVIGIVIIIAVMMHMVTVHQCVESVKSFPIVVYGLQELGTANLLLFEDQLLDGGQSICHGANANALWSAKIIPGAAGGDIHAFLNAVIHKQ